MYKDKVPSEEEVNKILESGRWAPSGLNNQPWRFLVVRDKKTKDGISKFTKYSDIIKDAPIIICVLMDIGDSYNRDKDIMAIGASIQNMLLQAWELEICSCWLGEILNQGDDVINYLQLVEDFELMAVITFGYPAQKLSSGSGKSLNRLML